MRKDSGEPSSVGGWCLSTRKINKLHTQTQVRDARRISGISSVRGACLERSQPGPCVRPWREPAQVRLLEEDALDFLDLSPASGPQLRSELSGTSGRSKAAWIVLEVEGKDHVFPWPPFPQPPNPQDPANQRGTAEEGKAPPPPLEGLSSALLLALCVPLGKFLNPSEPQSLTALLLLGTLYGTYVNLPKLPASKPIPGNSSWLSLAP